MGAETITDCKKQSYIMHENGIQELLAQVEKPSRYLGNEINTVRKDPSRVALRIALAFPDLYEIGTSHFGMQILYNVLNAHPDVYAERVFAPALDLENLLQDQKIPLFSLETQTPLRDFDIMGFSLLYELNYTNMLSILKSGGIPWRSDRRAANHPLIIAGGPCTCNPEPVADFLDAVVVGEGESVIIRMVEEWLRWKSSSAGSGDRDRLLSRWARLESVYVPVRFPVSFDQDGFQRGKKNGSVRRAIEEDLETAPFPEAPVLPYGKPIHDRLRIEVSRGCTRGCRFCQAGMIYRPVRERSLEKLASLARSGVRSTGYEDVSLLSLSTGDYSCISPLMENLMARFEQEHVSISLPSLRAGTLTPNLMAQIKKVRKTGFTIAPEAGSQRLRDVINKNITEDQIFQTVEDAFRMGWQAVKLYFMIGLPTEREEDIEAMVDLVFRLKATIPKTRKKGQLNVSVATFIPKPHTPFQWCRQMPRETSHQLIQQLKARLNRSGIHFKWQNPSVSWLEGLWARGDRRFSRLLEIAHDNGCRFDGWSDQFRFDLWEKAIEEAGIDPDFYLHRDRALDEPLPWDHIDTGVEKDFLWDEYQKALDGEVTGDCRGGDCRQCGVCDFETIEPRIADTENPGENGAAAASDRENVFVKVCMTLSKRDSARFLGHLETVNVVLRAIRRAGVPLRYSEGFHPKPKIQFEDPLPLGMESRCEKVYFYIPRRLSPEEIGARIDRQLPDGLRVMQCSFAPETSRPLGDRYSTYRITAGRDIFSPERIQWYEGLASVEIVRKSAKGSIQRFELKEILAEVTLQDASRLRLSIKEAGGPRLRPKDVIRRIFQLPEEEIARLRIEKTKETCLQSNTAPVFENTRGKPCTVN